MKKFIGKTMAGKVVLVHMGNNEDLSKDTRGSLTAEIGGFAGDKHQGLTQPGKGIGNLLVRYAATNASGQVFQSKNWLTLLNA